MLTCVARRARPLLSSSASLRLPFARAMSAASADTKHFILQYNYVPDILEKRDPYRAEHLQNAKDLKAQGKILMGGALLEPVDGGVFIFTTNDKSEIEAFAQNDPYVKNKLVTSYTIREWMVVV